MPQYVLREIPVDLWARFTERAKIENWPLRALLLQLIDDYGQHRGRPSGAPPEQMPIYAWVRPYYRHLAKEPGFLQLGLDDQWERLQEYVRAQTNQYGERTLAAVPPPRRVQVLNWLRDTSTMDLPGPNRLSMRAIAHIGSGPSLAEDRRAFQYEVLGLPPGVQAWIADFPGEGWRTLRVTNGAAAPWIGNYPTAKDALRGIEIESYIEDENDPWT